MVVYIHALPVRIIPSSSPYPSLSLFPPFPSAFRPSAILPYFPKYSPEHNTSFLIALSCPPTTPFSFLLLVLFTEPNPTPSFFQPPPFNRDDTLPPYNKPIIRPCAKKRKIFVNKKSHTITREEGSN